MSLSHFKDIVNLLNPEWHHIFKIWNFALERQNIHYLQAIIEILLTKKLSSDT